MMTSIQPEDVSVVSILDTTCSLHKLNDLDMILDRTLSEACTLTSADFF